MIKIPQNIEELKSYNPGMSIEDYKEKYGLGEVAVLWNNENSFGASPMAVQKIKECVEQSYLYPDPLSIELRSLIAAKYDVSIDQVVVGNGSEAIMANMFKAFCGVNDHILTSEGTFIAVYIWAKSSNVPLFKVPLKEDYSFDLDAILDAITPYTKIIYISNPNNPTGTIVSEAELTAFLKQVPDDIMVVIDEAYIEYAKQMDETFPDSSRLGFENVMTFRTFSKAYGVAGARIGYAIGNPRLIEAMNKVRLTFAPSNLAQAAGIGAIQDDAFISKTVGNNAIEIARFYEVFDALGIQYIPSLANFVMIELKDAEEASALCDSLLREGVFVRWLRAFGLEHCVRITIGTPEENDLFIRKMKKVYSVV